MSENLIRFETEHQRQERASAILHKREVQQHRNRLEWIRRMNSATLAGDFEVARYILETQLKGRAYVSR